MNSELRWMDYALRLGRRALGTTAENPPVGCVIIKNEKVLGIGWTQPGGRPHAETEALAMAGEAVKGATAYVTLEPCAHHGRTPPCAEALVKAEIARALIAIEDPDPRTAGQGVAMLREAGIDVSVGAHADEARRDLAGFLTRITKNRPYVTLKLALSADDKIAAAAGQRTAITGPEANARVHLLRAQSDAILVGMATVRTDDPSLSCRLPGLEYRSPKPFVLGHGALPSECKLAKRGAIMLSNGNLLPVLNDLAGRGINRLMVEGGAKVARAFLEQGLVDEFHLYRSPAIIGPDGVSALAGLPIKDALQPFRLREQETLGADVLSVYERSS